jgi:BirA family biotin operon repressor/biotin-[acetyl-CoA-carboxylase] ligase
VKPLDADIIFAPGAEERLVGAEGELLERVGSTMDAARERFAEGVPDGYVVLAEHQRAGRGREGGWECPPGGGVLMSAVLRRGLASAEQRLIAIMGAVAAAEAVGGFGVPARIKWPNDVVVAGGPRRGLRVRKLGGVLVESVERGDAAPAHILGVGLNVNQAPDELPPDAALEPTSMRRERGQEFDRNAVCRALLDELSGWYRRLAMGQNEHILARWRTLSCLLGHALRARLGDRVLRGTVVGIRSTGELILEDASGGQAFLSDERTTLLL